MSHPPDSKQSGSQQTAGPFGFSGRPPLSHSPETVVHPERQAESPEASIQTNPVDVAMRRRLFPTYESNSDPDRRVPSGSGEVPQSPAGAQLEHFVVEEPIGRGGMGAVFRAVDQRLQRVVALKVLSPDQSQNQNAVQRFQNEACASARLDHDNIARVYYVGEDHGLHFIVYEYVTGRNIRDLISLAGPLNPAEAINYTLQIASALKHTSAAGVVHRDIKPSNIIVTPLGRAKLVDLGLARKEYTESADELTMVGTTLGTFDYISPEQARDPRNVDVRSDIYSLGCTLYQMLTGEPPYPEGTMYQKLLKHDGKEPPDPAQKNPRVSPQLSAVVKKMMASDPNRRQANADELIRELMTVASGMSIRTLSPDGLVWSAEITRQPAGFWERHLGWMATAAALLLIVFLLDRFHERLTFGPDDDPAAAVGQGVEDADVDAAADGRRPEAGSVELAATDNSQPATDSAADASSPGDADVTGGRADTTGADEDSATSAAEAETIEPPADSSEGSDSIAAVADEGSPDATTVSADGGSAGSSADVASSTGDTRAANGSTTATSPDDNTVSAAAAGTDDSGGTVESNSGSPEPPNPPTAPRETVEPPQISITGAGEAAEKAFNTLEAACHAAQDGNAIVLRYNGRRGEPEKPLRLVDKRITILGEKGYRPVIEFRPREDSTGEWPTRMMTLMGGFGTSLELIDVDVHVVLPENADSSLQWALFSLLGAEQVRLRGVRITFENTTGATAASVIELTTGPSRNLTDMKMMQEDQPGIRKEFEIKMIDSYIRGGCDLLRVAHTRPGRFFLERSAVAVEGVFLSVVGDLEMPEENADLELQMEHVTCLLGDSLIRWDSGSDPRDVLPVHVTARNNILSTKGDAPLIAMTGNTDSADFRALLGWSGERNFYDRFAMFWTIDSELETIDTTPLDFNRWKAFWDGGTELDPHQEPIVWHTPWWEKEFFKLPVDELRLDREAQGNPAVGGAVNGKDAGADLELLPAEPQPTPAPNETTAEQGE